MKIKTTPAIIVLMLMLAASITHAGTIIIPPQIALPTPVPFPTPRLPFTRVTSLYIGLEEMQWVEDGLSVTNLTVYNYRTNREYAARKMQNFGLGLYQIPNVADFIVGDLIYINSWGSSNANGYERYAANAHRIITGPAAFFSVTVPFIYLD